MYNPPATSIPSIDTTTVAPETTTAWPAVRVASSTAARTGSPERRARRARCSTNSA